MQAIARSNFFTPLSFFSLFHVVLLTYDVFRMHNVRCEQTANSERSQKKNDKWVQIVFVGREHLTTSITVVAVFWH